MDFSTLLSHLDSAAAPPSFRPGSGPCGGRVRGDFSSFRRGPGHCGRGPPCSCKEGGPRQTCSKRGASPVHPPFDVREVADAYELQGELPGVELAQVLVEFDDAQTLVISGRIERPSPSKSEKKESEKAAAADDEDDLIASEYHEVTVEDEKDEDDTRAATEKAQASTATVTPAPEEAVKPDAEDININWVRERSFGDFRRSFTFASLLQHDGVRASLRNGVLSVRVPKAAEAEKRSVVVQEG
ncbi:MAG: hypothetical protein M1829_000691 [Trizodia sp. TS-e1964]|nr:MAG: hypothetical protein M1829_000691 [Trizodia sp. TS-e1964]